MHANEQEAKAGNPNLYYIRTNIFFQSNGSQHAGQVVIPIRRDILEVRARRML